MFFVQWLIKCICINFDFLFEGSHYVLCEYIILDFTAIFRPFLSDMLKISSVEPFCMWHLFNCFHN